MYIYIHLHTCIYIYILTPVLVCSEVSVLSVQVLPHCIVSICPCSRALQFTQNTPLSLSKSYSPSSIDSTSNAQPCPANVAMSSLFLAPTKSASMVGLSSSDHPARSKTLWIWPHRKKKQKGQWSRNQQPKARRSLQQRVHPLEDAKEAEEAKEEAKPEKNAAQEEEEEVAKADQEEATQEDQEDTPVQDSDEGPASDAQSDNQGSKVAASAKADSQDHICHLFIIGMSAKCVHQSAA